MKSIRVTIKGIAPLLMHNPAQLMENEKSDYTRKVKKKNNATEEAEKSAYRDEKGKLYLPANAVFSAMIHASKNFRIKTTNLSNILGGSIRIEPEKILLNKKEYEIFSTPVVIQRAHIIRHRPLLRDWEASFTIIYDEEWITNGEEVLEKVLETAGKRSGLLDYRPQRKGPYGTFMIKKWEKKNE